MIEDEFRGNGIGSKVVEEIIEYAKKHNFKQILLSPQPLDLIRDNNKNEDDFKRKSRRLVNWYSRFGFKEFKNNINDKYSYMRLPVESESKSSLIEL